MKARNLPGLTDAFVVAYSRTHDIQSALEFVFALDDYARGRDFDATGLGLAVLQRRPAAIPRAEVETLAQQHGLTADHIIGTSKLPRIVAARRHAMAVLRQRWSVTQVAAALGIARSKVSTGVAAWRAQQISKAEGGGTRGEAAAAGDPREGSEAAPTTGGGGTRLEGPAGVPAVAGLAAGGLSASPAKLSRRAA